MVNSWVVHGKTPWAYNAGINNNHDIGIAKPSNKV
jgi:hypothetical protein